MKILSVFLLLGFLVGCSSTSRFNSQNKNLKETTTRINPENSSGIAMKGLASYYGPKYHGRKTASGEVFDMYQLTAAHKQLAFGTKLKVTNISNGKSVVVKVNDRGPFVGNRILDLSYEAAKQLDMLSSGVAEVKLEII